MNVTKVTKTIVDIELDEKSAKILKMILGRLKMSDIREFNNASPYPVKDLTDSEIRSIQELYYKL